jgi:hypothetical protein
MNSNAKTTSLLFHEKHFRGLTFNLSSRLIIKSNSLDRFGIVKIFAGCGDLLVGLKPKQ